MEGGGAGQGARHTGTAATPAAHPRAYKQNALGKLFAKESWESSFLFSHPRLLLSFQKETVALFFPAASFPTLPSPDRALAVRLSSQDLKGGESGSLAEAQPSAGRAGPGRGGASSCPAGGVPGARWALRSLSPNRLTHPAPFPFPEPGSSLPPPLDSHPEVARRLGGIRAREAASRREKWGGDGPGPSWNFLPAGLRGFGDQLGKPSGKETPRRSVPIPTARASVREARRALVGQVGRRGE